MNRNCYQHTGLGVQHARLTKSGKQGLVYYFLLDWQAVSYWSNFHEDFTWGGLNRVFNKLFILKLITFQSILNHVFRPVRFYGGSQKFKITKQQILTYKITDKQTDTNTFWWSNCTQALFSGWVKKNHRTKITNTTIQ